MSITHNLREILPEGLKTQLRQPYTFARRFLDEVKVQGSSDLRSAKGSFLRSLANGDTQQDDGRYPVGLSTFVGRICKMYELQKSEDIPYAYRVGEVWAKDIAVRRSQYLMALRDGDFDTVERLLKSFHRNGGVAGLNVTCDWYREQLEKSFFPAFWVNKLVEKYEAVKRLVGDHPALKLIDESWVGAPVSVHYDGKCLSWPALRHAWYCYQIETHCRRGLSSHSIAVELGSGYGDLARMMKSLYGRQMCYVLLDVPEVLLVAAFFIFSNFPTMKIGLYEKFHDCSKITRAMLQEYDFVILPNWFIERFEQGAADLVINTNSLAEMDYDIICNYLNRIESVTRGYFYTANRRTSVAKPDGYKEVGMDRWPLDFRNWTVVLDQKSWSHIWIEDPDYRELLLARKFPANENAG